MLVILENGIITDCKNRITINDGEVQYVTGMGIVDVVYPIDESTYVKTGQAIRI